MNLEDLQQAIIDGVANHGAEALIKTLSDACYIAAAVEGEQFQWAKMSQLLHYAKNLEELPLGR